MAKKRRKRRGSDRALIALSQPHEVRYWSKKFRVTPAKLKDAVKKVGRSSRRVGDYIKLQRHKASDRWMIATKEDYEVRYWSKKFKVTPMKLKAAVRAAGRSSKRVGAYLAAAKKSRKKSSRKKKL